MRTPTSHQTLCVRRKQTSQVEVMKLDYLRLCSRAWDNPGLIWSCLRDNWNWVSHNCVVNSDSMGRHAVNSATVFRKFVRFQDGFQDQFQDRFLYETPSPPRSLAWCLMQPQVVWWVTSSFGIWGSRPLVICRLHEAYYGTLFQGQSWFMNGSQPWNKKKPLGIVTLAFGCSMTSLHSPFSWL